MIEPSGLRIIDSIGRPRVTVPGLTNRSGIDQVSSTLCQGNSLSFAGEQTNLHAGLGRSLVEREDRRHMGVAEKNHLVRQSFKCRQRIIPREEVGVFVMGRSMANGQLIINCHRSLGKILENLPVSVLKGIGSPFCCLQCEAVEVLTRVNARTDTVMISTNRKPGRPDTPEPVQDLVG